MGGNTKAINRETGEIIALANKIDLNKINRTEFKKNIAGLLFTLNEVFKEIYKYPIWEKIDIITNGQVFNGSGQYLYDDNISDDEFKQYKSKIGDIDVTVPKEYLQQLFELLTKLESRQLTKTISYIGQNKKNQAGAQINAIFNYEGEHNFQIDFEGTEFENGEPNEFAKFAHSSDWEDIKLGFKGVAHKFLLVNLIRAASANKNIVLLTPASSTDPTDKKFRIKKYDDIPRMLAFSVDKGCREKYKQIFKDDNPQTPLIFQGKLVYKDIPTDESNYITNVSDIFKLVFKTGPSPEEIKLFNSFTGCIELCKKYIKKQQIIDMFKFLLSNSLFGNNAQQLSRDEWKDDMEVKFNIINKLYKEFPYLKEQNEQVREQAKNFYKSYGKTKP